MIPRAVREIAAIVTAGLFVGPGPATPPPTPIRNIVLVHGAFADGSGWRGVYDILVRDGYHVTLVQQPLTSFEADVAATMRQLDQLDGPCVLVGHSYGGAVITAAGNHPRVAALVYVAAHALDEGETEVANGKRYPNAARPLESTPDGYVMLDPANFPADFAADLPPADAAFMARSQIPTAKAAFSAPAKDPAWKHKPSWYAVATLDRMINPDLERMYASRAHSHVIEVQGASHAVYVSHPREIAALIEQAAAHE